MKRLAKPEGKYNLVVEEAPVPEPGPGEVRVKAVRSLISRGSEMGARYTREHAVSPAIMGYSMAGAVDAVGEGVSHLAPGDRVVSLAPHAEYTVQPAAADAPRGGRPGWWPCPMTSTSTAPPTTRWRWAP